MKTNKKQLTITVLNNYYLDKKSINILNKAGELKIYQNITQEKDIISCLKNSDIAIIDPLVSPITNKVIAQTQLKLIALSITGFDSLLIKEMSHKGIAVANAHNYCTIAVAEYTLGLIIMLLRKLKFSLFQSESYFEVDPTNTKYKTYCGSNLSGKIIGIIGFGKIGKQVAKLLTGFDCKVIYYDILKFNSTINSRLSAKPVSLDTLLKSSDIITLHTPLNISTLHMINKKSITQMKKNVVLINTSRGGVIKTDDLFHGLVNKTIGCCALDVLSKSKKQTALLKMNNVIITPHNAFYSNESITSLSKIITNNVLSFVNGNPINIVNPDYKFYTQSYVK